MMLTLSVEQSNNTLAFTLIFSHSKVCDAFKFEFNWCSVKYSMWLKIGSLVPSPKHFVREEQMERTEKKNRRKQNESDEMALL